MVTTGIVRRHFLQTSGAAALLGASGLRRLFAAQRAGAEGELIVRTAEPFNAEPRLNALVANRITPVSQFYVRNHGTMPKVDPAGFRVKIEGLVERPGEWTLGQLKERFAEAAAEATLTCAGNRRQELSAIQAVNGVQWDAGAIGHASWSGVKLAEVLKAAGIQADAKHVWFDGLDDVKEKDGSVAPFGGSISLEKAMASDAVALLAHAMNGQPLTAEHGFPLRTIVPGFIGARSVKWLAKITVSDRPSPNHYVADAYKVIQTDQKSEAAAADPIYAFPVNAAICLPAGGMSIKAGRVAVSGYALPRGDRGTTLRTVELSADGGKTWKRANLSGEARPYAWQLWTIEMDLPRGKHELAVRATDSAGNSMAERGAWNLKGYLYNGWHRVNVEVTG